MTTTNDNMVMEHIEFEMKEARWHIERGNKSFESAKMKIANACNEDASPSAFISFVQSYLEQAINARDRIVKYTEVENILMSIKKMSDNNK